MPPDQLVRIDQSPRHFLQSTPQREGDEELDNMLVIQQVSIHALRKGRLKSSLRSAR